MPSSIKNTVRLIQRFYSDGVSVEKAKTFWDAFERATVGLDEPIRLSVFRECLKSKPGEEWWLYSQIDKLDTLRMHFHNHFICHMPLQMFEHLKTTKRSKGMSAEFWGDPVSGLCDAAQCYDSQMRYQFFMSSLRNKEWKAALATTMVNSISQVIAVLLYKNMHLPVEESLRALLLRQPSESTMQQPQNYKAQQQKQHLEVTPEFGREEYPVSGGNSAMVNDAYEPGTEYDEKRSAGLWLYDDDYGGGELAGNEVSGHVEQVSKDSYEGYDKFGDVKTQVESDDDKTHGYEVTWRLR
ncbi:hypothetical protein PInf_018363 [Phytophthora infestans]|nr:hypothetical protein PInf_018363 [Phytophthora infestans]